MDIVIPAIETTPLVVVELKVRKTQNRDEITIVVEELIHIRPQSDVTMLQTFPSTFKVYVRGGLLTSGNEYLAFDRVERALSYASAELVSLFL